MKGRLAWVRQLARDGNMIVALAALATSVVAVMVAWDEARIVRQAYRTAFSPVLEVRADMAFSESEESAFVIEARNVGPGAAAIEGARVTARGEPVADWLSLTETLLTPRLAREARFEAGRAAGFLRPGEDEAFLRLVWSRAQPVRVPLRQHVGGAYPEAREAFAVEVCYCSLFEECWVAATDRTRPEKTEGCDGFGAPFAAIEETYRNPA